MCHLALEKILKAHVSEVTGSIPARTHNLLYLVGKAGLNPPSEYLDFLGDVNNASIPSRYPEDLKNCCPR